MSVRVELIWKFVYSEKWLDNLIPDQMILSDQRHLFNRGIIPNPDSVKIYPGCQAGRRKGHFIMPRQQRRIELNYWPVSFRIYCSTKRCLVFLLNRL